ncbi:MAG: hypothetical protein IJD04_01955, partial [Desulfovibrionaceae bacterium]|nr:hypothetical protein [Desulfovibrionaceae bacterium]
MSEKSRRMLKMSLKIISACTVALFALAVFTYFFLSEALSLNQRIPAFLAQELGLECRVEKVHIAFLPKPGLLLDNIIILPPGETFAANPQLKAAAPLQADDMASKQNASAPEPVQSMHGRNDALPPSHQPAAANGAVEMPAEPLHPPVSHLEIGKLAIYLDIPQLLKGNFQPDGLKISNLSLNLAGLGELSQIAQNILNKVKNQAEDEHSIPVLPIWNATEKSLTKTGEQAAQAEARPPASTAAADKPAVIVEESPPETIAGVWEILKKVQLDEAAVFIPDSRGDFRPLLSHIRLHEFFGSLGLSFSLNIPIDGQPYALDLKLDAGSFQADFDTLALSLEASAEDAHGFDASLNTDITYNYSSHQVFFNDFLLKTGKTSLSADLILEFSPDSSNHPWRLKGPALLNDFDLPRWVEPLTGLSPETQTLLGQISGNLELEFNPEGLLLHNIAVNAGPFPWQGDGKILFPGPDPQLGFYLKTPELPLEAIFPAVAAPGLPPRFTDPPPSFNAPYFLSGEVKNAPPVELVLEADTLLLRHLKAGGFKAEMHNHPTHVSWKFTAADIGGGRLDAVLLDNDDYTLVSEGSIASAVLENLLPGMGWQVPLNGRTDLTYKLEGPTATPEAFLENMKLTLEAKGTDILFAAPKSALKDRSARNFNFFERVKASALLQGQSLQAQNLSAGFMISGDLDAEQQKDNLKLKVKGPVNLDKNDNLALPALNIEGKISSSLAFLGFSKKQSGTVKAKVQYSEAASTCTVEVSRLELAEMNAKAVINAKNLNKSPILDGDVHFSTASLRKFLAGMGGSVPDIPEPLLREAELSAKLSAASGKTSFTDLKLKIDYMLFQGKALHDSNNKINLELSGNEVDLDAYFPDKEEHASAPPAEPWNTEAWLRPDIRISLALADLKYMKLTGKNVKIQSVSGQGKLKSEFTADLCGGRLHAQLSGHTQNKALACSLSARLEHA